MEFVLNNQVWRQKAAARKQRAGAHVARSVESIGIVTLHTTEESYAAGYGLLLRDKEHKVLYRARVVGDSYNAQGGSTATIDYEPVP